MADNSASFAHLPRGPPVSQPIRVGMTKTIATGSLCASTFGHPPGLTQESICRANPCQRHVVALWIAVVLYVAKKLATRPAFFD